MFASARAKGCFSVLFLGSELLKWAVLNGAAAEYKEQPCPEQIVFSVWIRKFLTLGLFALLT